MLKTPQPQPPTPARFHKYPLYALRFWHGMRFRGWMKLLAQNKFQVHPWRLPLAGTITFASLFNSVMYRFSQFRFGKRIEETEVRHPPIFIIGHWRSGTTWLHELMVRDQRFGFPSTYACFAPWHFLHTGRVLPKMLRFLTPPKRPMDNMDAGFELPQEDEFALCAMGARTPYRHMAFPNRPAVSLEALDGDAIDGKDRETFKARLLWFIKALTLEQGKPLVLKSPPHTGRIALLSELFPEARFIHIVRDPYSVFPSTQRLWQALDGVQGLQFPRHANLDEYIFSCFETMYRGFNQQRPRVAPGRLSNVRYEDLAQDPINCMRRIYNELELDGFDAAFPAFQEHVAKRKDYKTNRHQLEPELQSEIDRRWGDYQREYGYAEQ